MLAVSLDLEALSRGSTEFRASSDVECSLQLIFEFVDGSMLFWPDLQPGDARGSLDLQPQQLSEQLTKQDPGIADQVLHLILKASFIQNFPVISPLHKAVAGLANNLEIHS